ncbi:uncharacterized protein BP01DRAFT_367691 [Aspergillus saccharolyticus JOP 1030-1]|uniref:Uncharacterized protein n=1 Tax=Aspergillus saccharolyticus JOP 1030-1 TaxID=1450539 RepID=A0A318ZGZ3_9EURO|nr:hypothetical protein BP01DRAFT_367691 [Aspergillus saccharolyticus JOP 1030-1]PYH42940.1 hypothetical protein BP01DRAFT_367691 [Aspergillus saccharolyticus JOP 1030-1]
MWPPAHHRAVLQSHQFTVHTPSDLPPRWRPKVGAVQAVIIDDCLSTIYAVACTDADDCRRYSIFCEAALPDDGDPRWVRALSLLNDLVQLARTNRPDLQVIYGSIETPTIAQFWRESVPADNELRKAGRLAVYLSPGGESFFTRDQDAELMMLIGDDGPGAGFVWEEVDS